MKISHREQWLISIASRVTFRGANLVYCRSEATRLSRT